MVLGVALGAVIAQFLPNKGLQVFFVVFVSVVAILRSLMGIKPTPSRQLPRKGACLVWVVCLGCYPVGWVLVVAH